jgi:hypothetical protein
MQAYIKAARKALTVIELEAGTRHPEKPDWKAMRREAEELKYVADKIARDINELDDTLKI